MSEQLSKMCAELAALKRWVFRADDCTKQNAICQGDDPNTASLKMQSAINSWTYAVSESTRFMETLATAYFNEVKKREALVAALEKIAACPDACEACAKNATAALTAAKDS